MKILHHAVWIILALLLQPILNNIEIFGVHPEICVVLAVLIGFWCGRINGLVFGMVLGLLFDLSGGRIIGITMLSLAVVGYASAAVSDKFYLRTPFYLFMILAAGATIFCELLYIIPYSAAVGGVSALASVRIIGTELILNAILILPFVWLTKKSLSFIEAKNMNYR